MIEYIHFLVYTNTSICTGLILQLSIILNKDLNIIEFWWYLFHGLVQKKILSLILSTTETEEKCTFSLAKKFEADALVLFYLEAACQ